MWGVRRSGHQAIAEESFAVPVGQGTPKGDGVGGDPTRFVFRFNGVTLFDQLVSGVSTGQTWRYLGMRQVTGLLGDGTPFLPPSVRALTGGDYLLSAA